MRDGCKFKDAISSNELKKILKLEPQINTNLKNKHCLFFQTAHGSLMMKVF